MTTDTITVPEIHCGHCKASLEGALSPLAGVEQAEVDVAERTVTVRYDPQRVSRPDLLAAIEAQGYEVPNG